MDEQQIAKALASTLTFQGVCASDELNKITKYGSYIINFDKSNQPGSHWISFYFNKSTLFYFDSFGVAPPQYIIKFAQQHHLKILYNTKQLQGIKNKQCGNFSIYFCMRISGAKTIKDFQNVIDSFK